LRKPCSEKFNVLNDFPTGNRVGEGSDLHQAFFPHYPTAASGFEDTTRIKLEHVYPDNSLWWR
jgi:hypothetical protein